MTPLFSLASLIKPGARQTLGQLEGSGLALAVAELVAGHDHPVVLLVADTPSALRLEQEVQFLLRNQPKPRPVLLFPDWETLPYDSFSPHQDIISQRLETLYHLPRMQHGLLIIPVATLMLRTPPQSFIDRFSLLVKPGDMLDLHGLRRRLEQAGYNAVEQVLEHGEFAARGSLLDLFPMGSKEPYTSTSSMMRSILSVPSIPTASAPVSR